MKTILIYESTHHGNTKKLVDAVAKRYGIRTATVEEAATMDLSAYDRVGIASGVAFGKVYEATERFMDNSLPKGKDVFFLERPFFPLYLRERQRKVREFGFGESQSQGLQGAWSLWMPRL